MAIKRYVANADTTITNAYKPNLITRGTGSNMGAADTLETFFIYGQESTGSAEVARILIKFPVADISADRTAGNIPNKDAVSFYLRMYNAEHALTLPKDFTLSVRPITSDWQEGDGLDMESYKHLTHDLYKGSNWEIAMSGSEAKAVATLTALSKTVGDANTRVLNVTDADGQTVNFTIDNSISTSTATKIAFGNANSNATQFATNIAAAINAANTANTCNVTATSDGAAVTLTQDTAGLVGETTIDGTAITQTNPVITVTAAFSTLVSWTTAGGDYEVDSHAKSQTTTFTKGTEDLKLDITALVEEWIASSRSNYGVGVHMTGSYESENKSYYTKKFFARSSEYFFKRPCIEARWDDSKKDDRGSFYLSSSMAPEMDNINTLYLYNYIRGQLKNIPDVGDSNIYVSMHTGTTEPESLPIELQDYVPGSQGTSANLHTFATGGWVETGIYTASIAIATALTSSNDYYYDVWRRSETSPAFFTGSAITPKKFDQSAHNPNSRHVSKITNLQSTYSSEETSRFRLYVRNKDWSPTIHTVASNTAENLTIEDAYYKIYRVVDNLEVISYGTGSTTNAVPQATGSTESYTRLSFDVSGNYFDLDMRLLEPGYAYGVKFTYYNNGYYHEQPETFKFRVEK